jgi:UDP-galactopyranose mutase
MKDFDFLIVGSGLYGAVFARQMTDAGKRCLVLEKRKVVGGNVRCENIEGINVHRYGPHIFHTNDKYIWQYVNRFAEFLPFVYSPLANYNGSLYNLPFNMNTFYQLWGTMHPDEAKDKIQSQCGIYDVPANLEEQAIALVGKDIYQKLIKGYTEKQWGRRCTDLPAFIIKRIPVRYTFDNNYFNDRYQGIPRGGYNILINGLLAGIEVRTGIDYLQDRDQLNSLADRVVYTGAMDEYFNYQHGELAYRSLTFKTQVLEQENYQGCTVINYTSCSEPFTRVIEHKHFEKVRTANTVITHEYPRPWKRGIDPYYPVNDVENNSRYKQYRELADQEQTIFGGRLASYQYLNMDQVIGQAMKACSILTKNPTNKGEVSDNQTSRELVI